MESEYAEQFQRLWENAFEAYRKETGRDIRTDNKLSRLASVEDLMNSLDQSSNNFTEFRSKRQVLRHRFLKVLNPVISITDSLQTFLPGTPGVVASPILAAVSYLVEVGDKVSQAYDYIEGLFSELEEFSERLEDYLVGGFDKRLEGKITAILAFFIKIIGRSEKMIKKGRFKTYLDRAFLGADDTTKEYVDELNRLIKTEQQKVASSTYASVKVIQRDMSSNHNVLQQNILTAKESIHQDISAATEGLQQQAANIYKESVSRADEHKLEETLKVPILERTIELYTDFKKRLIPGTGTWILKERKYRDWTSSETPLLFIVGEPGSGKTHLATSIIDDLKQRSSSNAVGYMSTAFFFIRESDSKLLNVNEMLKTIAYQIIESDPHFKRHAIEVCKNSWNTITAEDTWKNLFIRYYQQSPISGPTSAFIVLDGLDEAPKSDQQQIADILKDCATEFQDCPGIQFVVLGRPTIRNTLRFNIDRFLIKISRDQNRDDVELYIDKMLSQVAVLEKLKRLNRTSAEEERKDIRLRISEQSSGVFLWAQLLLDNIKSMDLESIKTALSRPPRNVTSMINGLFERIAAEEAEDLESLQKLLAWVCCSRRPLFFGELLIIMSLPSKTPRLLLWDALNTKFSTMFLLKMPDGLVYQNEVEDEEAEDEEGDSGYYGKDHPGNENKYAVSESDEEDREISGNADSSENQVLNLESTTIIMKEAAAVKANDEEDSNDDDDSSSESTIESDTDDSEEGGAADNADNDFSDDDNEEEEEDPMNATWELVGYLLQLDRRQLTTEVNFSHQQFRDVLLQSPANSSSSIRIEPDYSHVTMALSCFDILQLRLDEVSSYGVDVDNYIDYPLRNIAYHLQNIDIEAVSKQEKIAVKLLINLYWLFHEQEGQYAYFQFLHNRSHLWVDAWDSWIQSNAASTAVRNWFRLAEKYKGEFGPKTLEWMNQAASSAKSLFQGWKTSCARLWLERQGHDHGRIFDKGAYYCYFLHALDSVDGEGNIESAEIKSFSYRWASMGPLTAERIQFLANYAPESVQNTVHWYTNQAFALSDSKCYDEAMPLFHKAIEVDSDAWLAYEGLARLYAALEMYKDAIPIMEEACRAVTGVWDLSIQFYATIARWKRKLGDDVGALEAATIAYSCSDPAVSTIFSYLDCLEANDKIDEALNLLERLSEDGRIIFLIADLQVVRADLIEFDMFALFGRIIQRTERGRLAFLIEDVKKALERVLSTTDEWKERWFCWRTAHLVYEYGESLDTDYIIRNYENSLRLFDKFFDHTEEEIRDKQHITNFLARQYYDAAVAAHKGGVSPDEYVRKLKDLATITSSGPDSQEAFDFYGPGYPSVLWGRWRQIFEQAKKVKWRKCFRPRVLEELDMLDDENPENDVAGLYNLATTLLQAGDDKNASALLTILFRPLKALRADLAGQAETSTPKKPKDGAEGDTRPSLTPKLTLKLSECHKCCGDCEDKLAYETLYMCTVCPGRSFCGKCIEKAKSGTLTKRDCNPNHEWHRAWPSDEKRWKKVADEEEGGHLRIKPDWLKEMRAKWR